MEIIKYFNENLMQEIRDNQLVSYKQFGDVIQINSMTYKKPKIKELIELEKNHLDKMIQENFSKKQIDEQIKRIDDLQKKQPIIRISKDEYIDYRTGEIKSFNHTENRGDDLQGIRNTVRKLRDIINLNVTHENIDNCLFLTCTYAENMTDLKRLHTDNVKFIKRLHYKYGEFEYIQVAEVQERGAWHTHNILIFPKKTYIPNETIYSIWGHGFTQIQSIKGINNVGAYISSYLTDIVVTDDTKDIQGQIIEKKKKDTGESKRIIKNGRLCLYPKGMNIYRCSKGIKTEPTIQTLTYKKAVDNVSGLKRTYKSQVIIKQGDEFNNTITNEYYNILIKKNEE